MSLVRMRAVDTVDSTVLVFHNRNRNHNQNRGMETCVVDTGSSAVLKVDNQNSGVETCVVDTGSSAVLKVVDNRTVGTGAWSSRMTTIVDDRLIHSF